MAGLTQYLANLFTALDRLLNTLLLGDPDMTVTMRAALAKAAGKRWGCVLCRLLDVVDNGHCRRFGPK